VKSKAKGKTIYMPVAGGYTHRKIGGATFWVLRIPGRADVEKGLGRDTFCAKADGERIEFSLRKQLRGLNEGGERGPRVWNYFFSKSGG